MADSGITKRALADALKALMDETSFSRISVADICERCDMNRKSFYYHFKDKYDLLNWIIDTEFLSVAISKSGTGDPWENLNELFVYLYENRVFVRKAIQIEGQNAPIEHFRALLFPVLTARLTEILGDDQDSEFRVNFFCDAFGGALIRWIQDPACLPPEAFMHQLKSCVKLGADAVYRSLEEHGEM